MLEFDTGGNIRFEEGKPGDAWFSSCVDLVKSRLVRGVLRVVNSGPRPSYGSYRYFIYSLSTSCCSLPTSGVSTVKASNRSYCMPNAGVGAFDLAALRVDEFPWGSTVYTIACNLPTVIVTPISCFSMPMLCPCDVWKRSRAPRCTDASEVGEDPGGGIKVARVIRIHNRFLKNRFERRLREVTEDPACDKMAFDVYRSGPQGPSSGSSSKVAEIEGIMVAPTQPASDPTSEWICTMAPVTDSSNSRHADGNGWSSNHIIPEGIGECPSDSISRLEEGVEDIGSSSAQRQVQSPMANPGPKSGLLSTMGNPKTQLSNDDVPGWYESRGVDRTDSDAASDCDAHQSTPSLGTQHINGAEPRVSHTRNLEYLFYTGSMCFGGLSDTRRRAEDRHRGFLRDRLVNPSGCEAPHIQRHQDLLNIAENGFHQAGWSNEDTLEDLDGGRFLEQAQFGADDAIAPVPTRDSCPYHFLEAVCLLAHLDEESIKEIAGFELDPSALEGATGGSVSHSLGSAPRVLVAKAFTGCSRRVACSSDGSGESLNPDALGEAWKEGCTSVSIYCPDACQHSHQDAEDNGEDFAPAFSCVCEEVILPLTHDDKHFVPDPLDSRVSSSYSYPGSSNAVGG